MRKNLAIESPRWLTNKLVQEVPCHRVLAIAAFAFGAALPGEGCNVTQGQRFPVRGVGEEIFNKVRVRVALVRTEGDVRTSD